MLKVTNRMIADSYGVSKKAVDYHVLKIKGIKNIRDLYKILDFYERKISIKL